MGHGILSEAFAEPGSRSSGRRLLGVHGPEDAYGYDSLYSGNKELKAHRVFYEVCEGPIPDGMFLQHHLPAGQCIGKEVDSRN